MQINPSLSPGVLYQPSQKTSPGIQQASDAATAVPVPKELDRAVNGVGKSAESQAGSDSAAKQEKPPTESELHDSVKKLNEALKHYNNNLEFTVDEDTQATVVKVVDSETKKVIRQIPSEEALRIAKAIEDFKGLLLKDSA
ncbi:flagellar protein FlaG [Pseudogulbenkiania sp. MAI-1]|uniref:flagellar protein FlaG n=1 Tax=Pseudogulbenkiania sp. MAI-1 TaxID=990370 RepID=UPI0004A3C285|nr:flagellar protein FlaG [Pseudogulbenkiania sp. MAI-1]